MGSPGAAPSRPLFSSLNPFAPFFCPFFVLVGRYLSVTVVRAALLPLAGGLSQVKLAGSKDVEVQESLTLLGEGGSRPGVSFSLRPVHETLHDMVAALAGDSD